ncbi:hypothetical protein CA54_41460 [Symmachiella macrocystis]|uniref:Uncharacterized protein n=1 Tax=Symmachiella macrocystis TaxID=2527985 RepID=A0A5C6BB14_9PLAN|nr:hypothetical protein [Symmachiella macrocystis]TWU08907.1 hypothetical protein CA54_41460 [Symmachiella macrocystis]
MTKTPDQDAKQEMGDIPSDRADEYLAGDDASRARELVNSVSNRLMREKRWFGVNGIEKERNEMMRLARRGPKKMDKAEAQL